ncbi:MAG: imidazole glycerol phosphate synthase subunit HisH, partial [Nanoarchaeota archaeon]
PFIVKRFSFSPENEPKLRIPHMGWDNLEFDSKHFFFHKTIPQAAFYFVHSYHLSAATEKKSDAEKMIISSCNYGYKFPAVIQHENILATQFHPEKSQREGLNLLKNFLAWNPNKTK